MKRIGFVLSAFILIVLMSFTTALAATKEYPFTLELSSERYYFSDKYTVVVYLDDENIGSIKNGKTLSVDLMLKSGKHKLRIEKEDDSKIYTKYSFKISAPLKMTAEVRHEDEIELIDIVTTEINPTATPTNKPTATPTKKPTATPTKKPTATPTKKPTPTPSPSPTPTLPPTQFVVSASAQMLSNNHVGSSWSKEFRLNDKVFYGQTTITASEGDFITIRPEITENDKSPDVGYEYERYKITRSDIEHGFKKEYDIYVYEDRGRYAGNYAHWRVTYQFTSKYKAPAYGNTTSGNNAVIQQVGKVKVVGGTIVRSKNDTNSNSVGYIENETVLSYSEILGGWYYVTLPDGTRGYIYSSRCTEVN